MSKIIGIKDTRLNIRGDIEFLCVLRFDYENKLAERWLDLLGILNIMPQSLFPKDEMSAAVNRAVGDAVRDNLHLLIVLAYNHSTPTTQRLLIQEAGKVGYDSNYLQDLKERYLAYRLDESLIRKE